MDPRLQEMAADPTASPEQLHALASQYPDLGPIIAQNPACYPELREWLQMQAAPAQPPQYYYQNQPGYAAGGTYQAQPGAGGNPSFAAAGTAAAGKSRLVAIIVGASIAGIAAVGLGVAAATGNLGGSNVSVEQGCQNLADALASPAFQQEIEQASTDYLADMGIEDLYANEEAFRDGMQDMFQTAFGAFRSVSEKIGNREVRTAWDNYVDFAYEQTDISYMFDPNLSTSDMMDHFDTLVAQEAELLNELDNLCPSVDISNMQLPGSW